MRNLRDAHPPRHATVNRVGWEYNVGGEGEEPILILPGGTMVGEAGFTRIPAFEDRHAHVSTAAEFLDGLAGVLDAEGVRAAYVLGPSCGGIVAKGFVRYHPRLLVPPGFVVTTRAYDTFVEVGGL